MLRRFAATAACVLALDYSLSHAPVPGPTNASVITAAMAARAPVVPSSEMFTLRAKYERVPDELPVVMAAAEVLPPEETHENESLLERAGHGAKAAIDAVKEFATSFGKDDAGIDSGLDMRPAPITWPKLTREETCSAIELAALEHDLPVEFLGRLIWQESRHNAQAISPAGARGIAQFMPATAGDWGLQDPFDPVASLLKSAKFLRALNDRFGNVGLAAAAYNGGPGRLERWLETRVKNKKAALPLETQNYVRIITGKQVTDWVGVKGEKSAELKHTKTVPCVPQPSVIQAKANTPEKPTKPVQVASLDGTTAPAKPASAETPEWNVQVIGGWTEQKAHEQFAALKKKYPAMLGARRPAVFRANLAKGGQATFIRLAAFTQEEGQELCGKLKEAGGNCSVQKITVKTASKS